MAKTSTPEPEGAGFTPIEVAPIVDTTWCPIEVPSPAAPVAEIDTPATGNEGA